MKQIDILKNKSFEQLMKMAIRYNINFPKNLDAKDSAFMHSFFSGDPSQAVFNYMEEDDRGRLIESFENFTEEEIALIKKRDVEEKHKYEIVKSAMNDRKILENLLNDYLLNPTHMQEVVMHWYPDTEQIFRNAVDEVLNQGQAAYIVDFIKTDRILAEHIEETGYFLLDKTMYYESDDDRTHINGIYVGEDVAGLYQTIDTWQHRTEMEKRYIIENCIEMAIKYCCITPINQVIRLYDIIRQKKTYLSKISIEDVLEFIRINPSAFIGYGIVNKDGTTYFTRDYLSDDEEVFDEILEMLQNAYCEYYMPTYEEMLDFFENGYLSTILPLKEVYKFVERAIDEKKDIENIGTDLLMFGRTDPEERNYFRKEMFSRDDADDEIEEQFAWIIHYFYEDMEAEYVYENMDEFYREFTEEAKAEFLELLRACEPYLPKSEYLGHSKIQYEMFLKK